MCWSNSGLSKIVGDMLMGLGKMKPTRCWIGKRLDFWYNYPNRHCRKIECEYLDRCTNRIFCPEQSLKGLSLEQAYKKYGIQCDPQWMDKIREEQKY